MSTKAWVFHPSTVTAAEQRPHISEAENELCVIRNRLFGAERNSAWGRTSQSTEMLSEGDYIKKIKSQLRGVFGMVSCNSRILVWEDSQTTAD